MPIAVAVVKKLSQVVMEERRWLGLCYNCKLQRQIQLWP
jgi:hypothetical protein